MGLLPPEKVLINKYLDKEGKTLEADQQEEEFCYKMEN